MSTVVPIPRVARPLGSHMPGTLVLGCNSFGIALLVQRTRPFACATTANIIQSGEDNEQERDIVTHVVSGVDSALLIRENGSLVRDHGKSFSASKRFNPRHLS